MDVRVVSSEAEVRAMKVRQVCSCQPRTCPLLYNPRGTEYAMFVVIAVIA